MAALPQPVGIIDLGGTKLYSAILDGAGHVIADDLRNTDAPAGLAAVLDRMVESLQTAAAAAGQAIDRLAGIGIAAAGPVDTSRGHVVDPPNLPGWGDVALGPMMARRFGVPVVVENDGNAAAYGEYIAGAGIAARSLIYVTVSTGIGGGMVLDGLLYRGADGAAGEIGHMVLQPGGPLCGCGRSGCLEALASGTAIARDGRAAIRQGRAPILGRLAAQAGGEVTARLVADAARGGDPDAAAILTQAAQMLGLGLGSLVNLLNPDVIVIGGGVIQIGEAFLGPAEDTMRQVALPLPGRRVVLRRAALAYPAVQGLAAAARGLRPK